MCHAFNIVYLCILEVLKLVCCFSRAYSHHKHFLAFSNIVVALSIERTHMWHNQSPWCHYFLFTFASQGCEVSVVARQVAFQYILTNYSTSQQSLIGWYKIHSELNVPLYVITLTTKVIQLSFTTAHLFNETLHCF